MIQAQYRRPARSQVAYPLAGLNRSGTLSKALGTRGLGETHPEAVAAELIATGHLRRSLDDVLLDVALVALGRRGELGAQRVSEEFLLWLAFREIAAHACREREALDQARDAAVATCSDPTSRPTGARNMGPLAMRANFSRASTLATGQVRSEEPRPISTSRQPVLPRKVRSTPSSKNSGRPEPTNESSGLVTGPTISERRRPPAKPRSKIARSRKIRKLDGAQGVELGHDMHGEKRLLLDGRPCICAANAGEDGCDMAVLAVEGQGPLGEIPGERCEPRLDSGDFPWPAACARGAGSESREIAVSSARTSEGRSSC